MIMDYLQQDGTEQIQHQHNGVGIHHPAGDIKKISRYTQSTTSSGYDWRVKWSSTDNGHGVTEGGSSGSPLLNANKQIIGDLSTGSSACSPAFLLNGSDYYGKFSHSWDQNGNNSNRQLKPWLDPNNSGIISLNGKICGTTLFSNFSSFSYTCTYWIFNTIYLYWDWKSRFLRMDILWSRSKSINI